MSASLGVDLVLTDSPPTVNEWSPSSLRRKDSSNFAGHGDSDGELSGTSRLSRTNTRQHESNDTDILERQRAMDVDMAIHLSRARRDTGISSAVQSPLDGPQHQLHQISSQEQTFDDILGLSQQEQHEIDVARGVRPHSPCGETAYDPSGGALRPSSPSSLRNLPHLHLGHDPALPAHSRHSIHDDGTSGYCGLPTYQANDSQPVFDFSHLDEFSVTERASLGISSPKNPSLSFAPTVRENTENAGGVSSISSPRQDRQRKLSVSEGKPRRKGVGGKMALFESNAVTPVPTLNNRAFDTIFSSLSPTFAPAAAHSASGHDRPYRFSFYSNALSAIIHARSLSELPADGQTFEDLFLGKNTPSQETATRHTNGFSRQTTRQSQPPARPTAVTPIKDFQGTNGKEHGATNSNAVDSEGNTWWLDVQSPTDEEMKLLSKVFSIHPLTTEDIQMEETREKIELFRNYYLVCFRGFDQDPYSPTYLEPVNMYIIVFREGILSFHFRPTPHPQNVRRRIKQLRDYISVTSDWISYALIDDITDAFGPLIQSIEYEVDSIDDLVLILKEAEQSDMLRRIGTCRKKVMGLLRLMGNKADVVKGLAKRCNDNWRVAPTSDIGLYLSDIQDHLITMTQNLNHYEKILSRSHSNYLAQISIEMTDANNQINDVLSKLTALGTVLIPMNLVTGLWGMNVHVPGQDVPGYAWFVSIIASLAAFAVVGGYATYKLMVGR